MNYIKIVLSIILICWGIYSLVINVIGKLNFIFTGEYALAFKLFVVDGTISFILIFVGFMLYIDKKKKITLKKNDQNIGFLNRMKNFMKEMKNGLWLSIPTCGLSILVALGDIQSMMMVIFIPIILGLPWNIPGIIIMIGAGMGHGGDDSLKLFMFIIGAIWTFFAVTLNGSYISSHYKNKNDNVIKK